MTKMEMAIARLRALPLERQEELADYLLDLADSEENPYQLTDEQRAEVELAIKDADKGKFATQKELDALWRRAGLTK
jgi:hypothetical protein